MIDQEAKDRVHTELKAQDESHKWPIRGAFNVTDRAISIIDKLIEDGLEVQSEQDYYNLLWQESQRIVNDWRNWG